MTTGRQPSLPLAERETIILDTAARLFYQRGVRAVGMDELIAATGLAKMTVYRLYPTRDALVEAYLERLAIQILDLIDADVARHHDHPRAALHAILDAVESDLRRADFRGCPFANAAAGYDDDHPARRAAHNYRQALLERLERLAHRLPGADENLGGRLAALIDGAYLSAAHLGPDGPARQALDLARALVQAGEPT